MAHSVAEHCQAAQERCEQAKKLTGDERRLYLHDAINKLFAALDAWVTASNAKPLGRVLPWKPQSSEKKQNNQSEVKDGEQ